MKVRHLVLALCLGVLLAPAPSRAQEEPESPTADASNDSPYESMKVLARAMQLIRQDYIDEKKVSFRDLTYSALRGMLSELDPHSAFMEPKDFKGMQEDTRSEFGGLGVTVMGRNGDLTIVSVMEDTPGFQAGLLPGDQILKINGVTTDRLALPEAVGMLRGDAGERVTLTVARPATKEVRDYTVERAVIRVPSVKEATVLPPERTGGRRIGYVRLLQFNEPTAAELARALEKLDKEKIEALVLDLRSNPGGLLNSAVDVCSLFVAPNTRVVYTEGRSPSRDIATRTPPGGVRKYPLAILIDSRSASGSEIVAGALKDLKRAILVGETTFGKGSVQSVVSLPDGSAMRFTTAKYYTPSKYPIHEHGVAPDIRCTLTLEQEMRLWEARRRRELAGASADNGGAVADPQLDRAIDALAGALLYADKLHPARNPKG